MNLMPSNQWSLLGIIAMTATILNPSSANADQISKCPSSGQVIISELVISPEEPCSPIGSSQLVLKTKSPNTSLAGLAVISVVGLQVDDQFHEPGLITASFILGEDAVSNDQGFYNITTQSAITPTATDGAYSQCSSQVFMLLAASDAPAKWEQITPISISDDKIIDRMAIANGPTKTAYFPGSPTILSDAFGVSLGLSRIQAKTETVDATVKLSHDAMLASLISMHLTGGVKAVE